MTAEECANILRAFINHRERMNRNLHVVGSDGVKAKIDPSNDIFLHAVKFALACVEEKIERWARRRVTAIYPG